MTGPFQQSLWRNFGAAIDMLKNAVAMSLLDILFYNFRHVQHHVAQLNFMLRQEINMAPDWVALAES